MKDVKYLPLQMTYMHCQTDDEQIKMNLPEIDQNYESITSALSRFGTIPSSPINSVPDEEEANNEVHPDDVAPPLYTDKMDAMDAVDAVKGKITKLSEKLRYKPSTRDTEQNKEQSEQDKKDKKDVEDTKKSDD